MRQQRRVHIDGSELGNVQQLLRKNLTERSRNPDVRRKAAHRLDTLRAAYAFKLKDRNPL